MAGKSDNGIAYQPYLPASPPVQYRRVRRRQQHPVRHQVSEAIMVCGAVIAIGAAALLTILAVLY